MAAAAAPVLSVASDGAPMRFGVPVERAVLADGLSLGGRGVLQWRRLPIGDEQQPVVWIELAIVAPRGRVRVVRGGVGPSPERRGAAFVHAVEERRTTAGRQRVQRWSWVDGTIDERVRTRFTARAEVEGECYEIGEALTTATRGLALRSACWLRARGGLRQKVCRPAMGALLRGHAAVVGGTQKAVQRHLHRVVPRLLEMQGRRGAGDFLRSNGEVTNLEFDTTLGVLRCALTSGQESTYRLALRCAAHLRDRDIDLRSGLPFVHGERHRAVLPQPGHTWLQGLLWVGLLSADDEAVLTARGIARALAVHLPTGKGRNERLRDYAWPLLEMEALLRMDPSPRLAAAADRLAAAISVRFDRQRRTFCFGEGELSRGVYLERGWLTGGILLPALQAHLDRRPNAELRARVDVAQRALLDRVGSGAKGLPTHWRIASGRVISQHFERGSARSAWILDALPPRDRARLLARGSLRRALRAVPDVEHADLPTEFSMLARCSWLW